MPDNVNVAQFKTFASEESAIGAETGIRTQVYLGSVRDKGTPDLHINNFEWYPDTENKDLEDGQDGLGDLHPGILCPHTKHNGSWGKEGWADEDINDGIALWRNRNMMIPPHCCYIYFELRKTLLTIRISVEIAHLLYGKLTSTSSEFRLFRLRPTWFGLCDLTSRCN